MFSIDWPRARASLFAVFLTTVLVAGCDSPPPVPEVEQEVEQYGTLSAVVPSTGGATVLQLTVDESTYELVLRDDTEYTNIRETPLGTLWTTGGWYGVSGEIRGNHIFVDRIRLLPIIDGIPLIGQTEVEAYEYWLEKKCEQLEEQGDTEQTEFDCG